MVPIIKGVAKGVLLTLSLFTSVSEDSLLTSPSFIPQTVDAKVCRQYGSVVNCAIRVTVAEGFPDGVQKKAVNG